MSQQYGVKPTKVEEILKTIAKTPTGRKLLDGFLPMLTRGQVGIEAYPAEIVAKLRGVLLAGQPIGACLSIDPDAKSGRIHLDFGSPLGVLAPFLVHEIVHALDPRVWRGDTRESRRRMLEAEEDAFRAQFMFTEELRERDPAFDRFLRAQFPKARILNELLEPEDVEALYSDEAA